MTREEAINEMSNGKKVRHKYFSDNEYIQMDKHSGNIFSEDGVCWGHLYDEPMEIRKGGFWENDWEIFKEE